MTSIVKAHIVFQGGTTLDLSLPYTPDKVKQFADDISKARSTGEMMQMNSNGRHLGFDATQIVTYDIVESHGIA